MQLSKLTFSLASLVVLIAFGFIFVTVPVVADNGGVDNDGDHNLRGHQDQADANSDENTNASHKHPTVVISATDADPNTPGTQVVDEDADVAGVQFEVTLTVLDEYDRNEFTSAEVTSESHDGRDAVGTDAFDVSNLANPTGDDAPANAAMMWVGTASITGFPESRTDTNVGEPDLVKDQAAAIKAGLKFTVSVTANAVAGDDVEGDYEGQSNLATEMTFTVIAAAVPKDVAPAVGTVTGTPSFTDDFEVTFTFDKAVTMEQVTAALDAPVGATMLSGSLYADLSAETTNTVWIARYRPIPNPTIPKISVALKATTAITPIADDATTATVDESKGGMVELIRTSGSLTSITVPDDANDESTLVVVILEFASEPDEAPVATDFKLTPADDPDTEDTVEGATVGDIAALLGSDGKKWQVEITPLAGMATTVELSVAGEVKFGSAASAAEIPLKSTPSDAVSSIEEVDAAYASATATAKATTTITETEMLAANGFAVIGAGALPDIQRFFAEGGSISVLSSLTGAVAKDVVISEIMWGLNLRAIGAARSAHQFIELYNTSSAEVDLTDITLTFDGAKYTDCRAYGYGIAGSSQQRFRCWLVDYRCSG